MAWTFCQPAARAGSAAAQQTTGQNTRAGAGGGSSSSWAGRGGPASAAPSMSRRLRVRRTAWRAPLARRGTFAGGVTGHAEHTGGLAAVLLLCRRARQPLA